MRITWIAALFACLLMGGCQKKETQPTAQAPANPQPTVATPVSKVKITEVTVGKGVEAREGDRVWMRYKGTLKDGTVFDANMGDNRDPYSFVLGVGEVIKGWDQGIPGMKVGGMRKLEIPAALAYGDQSESGIPPNSDLTFVVELLGVVKPGEERVIDTIDQKSGTGRAVKNGDSVSIKYVAMLSNRKVFDRQETPFSFVVGLGRTLSAIDTGVIGMKVGGKRRIIAPPEVAYGGQGGGGKVPPGSLIFFDVDLIAIK